MACGHKGREFYANDPEKLARYDMAMRHIEAAREEGQSSEEIHAMFNRIMSGNTAAEGTGVIAGSATRELLELAGVTDVLTKIRGSKNKDNVARATLDGLKKLRSVEEVARLRGKSVEEILG